MLGCVTLLGKYIAPVINVGAQTSGVTYREMPGHLFSLLPEPVQTAVLGAFVVAILSRIGTWVYFRYLKRDRVESRSDRKARILSDFGYADPAAPGPRRRAAPAGTPSAPGSSQNPRQDIRALAGLR